MSLDAIYANDIESGIQRKLDNPGPGPATSFSTASFLAAGMRGVPAAALEVFGSLRDFSSASDQRYAQEQAYRAKKFGLPDPQTYVIPNGDAARKRANEFAPDPMTAHVADQVLYGFSRVGTKVAAATATGNIPAAAGLLFAEGANTAYQNLTARGIDSSTALKAGAVEGAGQAAALIPMAGPTIASTVGLSLAAGPVTFMTQEALSKRILEKAGYADEASRHDPLDPLGLTIATLLPAAFGGIHAIGLARAPKPAPSLADVALSLESGGKRFAPSGELLTSPKGAQGEMQVMPATATDPGFGVLPAQNNSPDELSRVGRDYIAAMEQRYGSPDQALAAYNAGPGAVDKAIAQHGADWLKHLPEETQNYVAKGMKKLGDNVVEHAAADPEAIDAARVRNTQDALYKSMPEDIEAPAIVARATEDIAAGDMPMVKPLPGTLEVEVSPAIARAQESNIFTGQAIDAGRGVGMTQPKGTPVEKLFSNFADPQYPKNWRDMTGRGRSLEDAKAEDLSRFREGMLDRAKANPAKFAQDEVLASEHDFPNGLTASVEAAKGGNTRVQIKDGDNVVASAAIRSGMIDSIAVSEGASGRGIGENLLRFLDQNRLANIDEVPDRSPGFVRIQKSVISSRAPEPEVGTPSKGTNSLPPPDAVTIEPPAIARSEPMTGALSETSQRVKTISEESPDLKVTLPGEETPRSVADALKIAEEQHAQEVGETSLIKAALDCALSFGS